MSYIDIISRYSPVLGVLYALFLAVALVSVIQRRGDPTKTIAWIIVITIVPLLGAMLYLTFGLSYRRRKMLGRPKRSEQEEYSQLLYAVMRRQLHEPDSVDISDTFSGLATMLARSSHSLPTGHNKVRLLKNAKAKYEALFEAIRGAQHHIHLEYYILADDTIGNALRELLEQKAREGVEVRLIYDDFGSWGLSWRFLKSLKRSGAMVFPFSKIHLLWFKSKVNNRNHRKIVVIDGLKAFVGGINIADHYVQGLAGIGLWRDTHVMLEGDAVLWLQAVFLQDWHVVSNERMMQLDTYLPIHHVCERCVVQVAASGPDSDWASIMQVYFAAINSAKKSVYITSPYFIPNESLLTAIRTAALRGVDVRLLMSARSDSSITQWASLSYIEDVLSAGVRVFLYEKGFSHSKLLTADGEFCSVGTANMDVRSFEHNFEVNAIIYQRDFVRRLNFEFERDMKYSTELHLDDWQQRPWLSTFMENLSRLLAPLL